MELSTQLENRASKDWSDIAGESVQIEKLGAALYAFGSELAVLRLLNKFKLSGDRAVAAFSKGRDSWYFRLELPFS